MTRVDDTAQLAYASASGWTIMTHNARHFRRLHRSFLLERREHGGIVVLPEKPPFERLVVRAAMMLTWLGTLSGVNSTLVTWGQLQEQLESAYRLPGFTEDEIRLALGRT